jgi:D-inositol-3-phosphate glycosyltransferase
MRISMVSEHASPLAALGGVDAGGQNVHVLELSSALADAGHDVTVWTRRDSPGLPDGVPLRPGVVVRHVTAGPAEFVPKDELVPHLPAFTQALDDAWSADPPDVVHAHFWMSGMVALAAAAARFPVVQTFHALGSVKRRHQREEDTSPDGRVAAELAVARQADRVLATCTDEVFELARMGVPRRRMTVVPCGVDTTEFCPEGPVAQRGDRLRLVSLGRLVRRKGVDEVIEALRRVPAAELVIAGGVGDGDPDAARLRECAERAGVAERVRLIGPVARPDVPALLRSADAVVCVPWYEPFGIVPLEAMACGRPVVASAVGGIQDTVVDRVTGLLVPPRRPDALAGALRDLLASATRGLAYGIAGRDRVLARYDWERVAAATALVYSDVVAARNGLAPVQEMPEVGMDVGMDVGEEAAGVEPEAAGAIR